MGKKKRWTLARTNDERGRRDVADCLIRGDYDEAIEKIREMRDGIPVGELSEDGSAFSALKRNGWYEPTLDGLLRFAEWSVAEDDCLLFDEDGETSVEKMKAELRRSGSALNVEFREAEDECL